jgi:hypothetical protein
MLTSHRSGLPVIFQRHVAPPSRSLGYQRQGDMIHHWHRSRGRKLIGRNVSSDPRLEVSWCAFLWIHYGRLTSQKGHVANLTLWKELDEAVAKRPSVPFAWVKGHSGVLLDECAGMLATRGVTDVNVVSRSSFPSPMIAITIHTS